MWQVLHSQCERETLAFFSKWFVWMLHSWVANNVLAGSSKKMRKSRVACDARALTHSQARFCRTASINEMKKKKSQFRVSILALAGSPNIPERKGLPAAPFTSANALVNSLAWFFGITGILETFSVSGTAY